MSELTDAELADLVEEWAGILSNRWNEHISARRLAEADCQANNFKGLAVMREAAERLRAASTNRVGPQSERRPCGG